MLTTKNFLQMTTAAAIAIAPAMAFGQTAAVPNEARGGMTAQAPADGTPGNPPSTATQRAADAVTGNRTDPDGTGNNPPGTAAGRALDRATTPSTTATGATTPGMAVDSMSLNQGRRASQLVGSNIYNEENNSIGEIDDLIVPPQGGQPVAIISVGGFLGIGAKLVAIPYERLTHDGERNRWMLRGATKDSLESLPAFSYDSNARRG
ncbi:MULTISPECIES: PRC-barrel domain-containing protein [Roseomonadaceae]|uniref:PRC-barrel domain-containing protein n=1 Tax=Falsiroseomonas oleicola TaxID=2801474 RepID=A0ABS6H4P1_9PROT|nr:PRC-barrel domain-containing protein [Roseomonas oleicola]MBU8543434.1 PRC-barrel domain-containing protein [Roseomonas oleicola]